MPEEDMSSNLAFSLKDKEIFWGSKNDLFKRHIDCALENGFDFVVRITCDDPFKDFDSAMNMLIYALANNLDFISNENQNSSWIEGSTLEIYKTSFLRWLYFNAWTSYQREHMEYRTIWEICPNSFKKINNILLIGIKNIK